MWKGTVMATHNNPAFDWLAPVLFVLGGLAFKAQPQARNQCTLGSSMSLPNGRGAGTSPGVSYMANKETLKPNFLQVESLQKQISC